MVNASKIIKKCFFTKPFEFQNNIKGRAAVCLFCLGYSIFYCFYMWKGCIHEIVEINLLTILVCFE